MMVVPIVAMLAVTMVVAGWQQGGEQDIDVVPGHGEIIIPEEEIPGEGGPETYPQNKSIATTYVNNESYLEFEVKPMYVYCTEREHGMRLKLQARGEFDENLEIEDFQFIATPSDGFFTFQPSFANLSGVSPWEYSKQRKQPESFGFSVDSNEFTVEITYFWGINREKEGDTFTLELEAIVEGLSEDVSVNVDVYFERGDEG